MQDIRLGLIDFIPLSLSGYERRYVPSPLYS